MQLVVHETPQEVADAAATRIAELILGRSGTFTFGLAGGNTPRATYRALRDRVRDWADVEAWLSDERWVPHDHDRCNGFLVANTLLDHVDAKFHRPHWSEQGEPADSAADYEATIRSIHQGGRPDVVLLGLGEDGHTASLFPGTAALSETRRWIVANEVPQLGETRLTATYPLLWKAKVLLVLVVGENKSSALQQTMDGATPAGRLVEGDAEVEWHVDKAAASLVSS